MIYMAIFILVFTGMQLIVAFSNLIFKQSLHQNLQEDNVLVSVLIPARNEEKNIENILSDLLQQNYKNIEILIFNDQSTDKTAEVVSCCSKKDSRIHLLNSTELPTGWLGKNFACYSLSKKALGEYFLFLDADVRIKDDIISQTISFTRKHKLGLLSIFPQQTMKSCGEYITVPNMNFILLSLLPLPLVRKIKYSSLSAANGQFMLFHTNDYKKINPHKKVKQEKVEDIRIARIFKKNQIKVACLAGSENISCRMYTNYKEAVNGFSKNILTFFGDSTLAAILFWTITTLGFLFVLFSVSGTVFLAYILTIILIRIFVSIVSKQKILENLIYLVPQQITLGIFIIKAIVKRSKKQFEWKGRNIS